MPIYRHSGAIEHSDSRSRSAFENRSPQVDKTTNDLPDTLVEKESPITKPCGTRLRLISSETGVEPQQGIHHRDRLNRTGHLILLNDRCAEQIHSIHKLDLQDPGEKDKDAIPDDFGTPLDRADGKRLPLFGETPEQNAVTQGMLDDCGVIAVLDAVYRSRPQDIHECIAIAEDGKNYLVALHEVKQLKQRWEPTGKRILFKVTPDLPVFADSPDRFAFAEAKCAWPPILEKTLAGCDKTWSDQRRLRWLNAMAAETDRHEETPFGYVRLNQGSHPKDRAEIMCQLTGKPAQVFEFPQGPDNDQQLLSTLAKKLNEQKPVVMSIGTISTTDEPLPYGLCSEHSYVLGRVGRDHIRVRDPLDTSLLSAPIPIDKVRQYFEKNYVSLCDEAR